MRDIASTRRRATPGLHATSSRTDDGKDPTDKTLGKKGGAARAKSLSFPRLRHLEGVVERPLDSDRFPAAA